MANDHRFAPAFLALRRETVSLDSETLPPAPRLASSRLAQASGRSRRGGFHRRAGEADPGGNALAVSTLGRTSPPQKRGRPGRSSLRWRGEKTRPGLAPP